MMICNFLFSAALLLPGNPPSAAPSDKAATAAPQASGFRIETEVFAGSETTPQAENLTLFVGQRVYDFWVAGLGERSEADQVTVLQLDRQRFVLLNRSERVKAVLPTQQILQFTTAMRANIPPASRQLLDPQFELSVDEPGRLTLASPRLTYRAVGVQTEQPDAAEQYRQFADWYARLNSMRLGNLTPFGRIRLNQALAERRLVPRQIERVIKLDQRPGQTLRSRHIYDWRLTPGDQQRISQTDRAAQQFESIGLVDYLQRTRVSSTRGDVSR